MGTDNSLPLLSGKANTFSWSRRDHSNIFSMQDVTLYQGWGHHISREHEDFYKPYHNTWKLHLFALTDFSNWTQIKAVLILATANSTSSNWWSPGTNATKHFAVTCVTVNDKLDFDICFKDCIFLFFKLFKLDLYKCFKAWIFLQFFVQLFYLQCKMNIKKYIYY